MCQKKGDCMLFLNNQSVEQVLTMEDCIRVHEDGEVELARGELAARPRVDVITATENPEHFYRWGTMEGSSKSLHSHAIRMKSDVIYYEQDGDRIVEEKYAGKPGLYCGLIFLFDTSTGDPLALIQDGFLQHMRVGAKNALGVKYISREDSHVVGMLGSGGQARSHLMAYAAVRPVDRCNVYSPNPEHREAYAKEMSEELGIDVVAFDDPRAAVSGTDIVACCTNSMRPVLFADMVEPGMHLTVVSGELAREVPQLIDVTTTSPESKVFRGAPIDQSRGQGGTASVYAAASEADLQHLAEISGDRYAERTAPRVSSSNARRVGLAELIAGEVEGRRDASEVSSSGGIGGGGTQGLSFVTVARLVYELARERGLGLEMPTDLFLQDIRD
jgi:alanine dehydrogenase